MANASNWVFAYTNITTLQKHITTCHWQLFLIKHIFTLLFWWPSCFLFIFYRLKARISAWKIPLIDILHQLTLEKCVCHLYICNAWYFHDFGGHFVFNLLKTKTISFSSTRNGFSASNYLRKVRLPTLTQIFQHFSHFLKTHGTSQWQVFLW